VVVGPVTVVVDVAEDTVMTSYAATIRTTTTTTAAMPAAADIALLWGLRIISVMRPSA